MLEIEGLSKAYPGFRLSLDLRLGGGEFVAVLGPSGCGKSTLLRLIAGLTRPDSGRILIDGRDVSKLPPERRGVGMVFQDFALFPHMSVQRNIEYGPRMMGLGRLERRSRTEALAASFEISPLLDRSPYSLSGGEQQRVALARTLAAKPGIVLLDEPLSSLDASLRRRLRTDIAQRLRSAEIAAILVTHDAEEALAVADRIVLIREGRIEAEGSPEDLYTAPPTAWSAAFLGRGPVLEVYDLERRGDAFFACTPLGYFFCESKAGVGMAVSLFFPSEAPQVAAALTGTDAPPSLPNRLSGRLASVAYTGRSLRVALDCPILFGPDRGATAMVELELSSSTRPKVGEFLAFEIPAPLCRALPRSR